MCADDDDDAHLASEMLEVGGVGDAAGARGTVTERVQMLHHYARHRATEYLLDTSCHLKFVHTIKIKEYLFHASTQLSKA